MLTNNHLNKNSGAVERGNASDNTRSLSLVKFVGISIILFLIAGMAAQTVLKQSAGKNIAGKMKAQLQDIISVNVCPSFIQYLPKNLCRPKENSDLIRQKLAQIPNLKTAISLLQWQGQTEQESVIFSTLVNALANGGWSEYGDNKEPWSITRKVLQPLWQDYPQTIAASRCYYCRYHASNLYEWYNSAPELHNELLSDIASTIPHQLNNLNKRLNVQGEELLSLVQLHSRLAFVGNREYFHAKILRAKKDLRHTLALIRNTTSAAPFWKVDLNTVPQNLVKLSWEQGVRHLDDHPKFTRHLVATGHKPALRWLIWILADAENFPNLGKMQRLRGQYQAILDQYTEGEANASTYSEKWDKIIWDAEKQKWIF